MKVDPKDTPVSVFYNHLVASVAPRPIAFASTLDKDGHPNLAPFSFFNVFGSKPPILVFSPARSVRDNINKHTLENIYDTMEVVINMVNYNMVQQTSLASASYPKEVDEFIKAGFTPIPSEIVKPFRVKESPVQMECKVLQVLEMGKEGGAANLIVCEIILMHIDDTILNEEGKIDPDKINLVGRMGGDLYSKAYGEALFLVEKPNRNLGIGFDNMPLNVRQSTVLSGNDLGKLANVETLPTKKEVEQYDKSYFIKELKAKYLNKPELLEQELHMFAKNLLDNGEVLEAWKVLLS